jgi:hypothetical protein
MADPDPDLVEWNGLTMLDAETVTCRECGTALKTIEQRHLQGSKCTGRLHNRADYRAMYPNEPVVTVDAYEGMTQTTVDPPPPNTR